MKDSIARVFRFIWLLALVAANTSAAEEAESAAYREDKDLLYRMESNDSYAQERCRLDVYYPVNIKDFPSVVWFHGGGLQAGKKSVPPKLKSQGLAVVAVNYRLHPKVQSPVYVEDAAAAVAWTVKNIRRYGGDPNKIYVSGHSAGGYLTSMVGLDKSYLAAYDIDANDLAGLIPFSGHTITHFTVRKERGIPDTQPVIDAMAPLFHVRPDAPPLVLITGDRELEMQGRYEENAYMMRMMKVVGHKQSTLHEMKGCNHGQMAEPAYDILLQHIRETEHN